MAMPIKSMKCKTDQCVEFKEFIGENLECPVCHEVIMFEDLAVDQVLMRTFATVRVRKDHSGLRWKGAGAVRKLSDSGV